MKELITMSAKETDRIAVLERVIRKEVKQKQAAKQLNLSIRQIRRLTKRYKRKGALGLIHKGRGRESNRKIPEDKIKQAMQLIKAHYHDFGPTLAHEKLVENYEISFSVERLRQAMISNGLWIGSSAGLPEQVLFFRMIFLS